MLIQYHRQILFALLASLLLPATVSAASFPLPEPGDDVVGELVWVKTRYEDTLVALARRFNVGYEELRLANPGIDPWLPGEGTPVLIPSRFVLPDAPRRGIVINVAEFRLYYYPEPRVGEKPVVVTYPVSVGRESWQTPLGTTRLTSKRVDPVWRPPESVRQEHAEMGDPLPSLVEAGEDNPLGRFAMNLGLPGYLIHGTNKPSGIGMRVTHGCIRLFPEDVESLFQQTRIGTPVHIMNQPYKAGWLNGRLYLEAHLQQYAESEGNNRSFTPLMETVVSATRQQENYEVDWRRADGFGRQPLGIPLSLEAGDASYREYYNREELSAAKLTAAELQRPALEELHQPERIHLRFPRR